MWFDLILTISLKKGTIAKYVEMANLAVFQRQIQNFELKSYNGGSKFQNNDTLLARITPCLENGKTAFVNIFEDDEIGFGSTEYIVLRAKDKITNSKFIYYLAISKAFRDIAISSMNGSSGRQRVQTDVLESHECVLPPLEEQERIAEILSSFDDKIEINHKICADLESMAQVLFRENFIKNPARDTWETVGLSDVAEFINGLAMQKYRPKDDEPFYNVIKIKELKNGFSDQTERCTQNILEKHIINNGDIIFSWSGSLEVGIWAYGTGGLNQHLFKVISNKYPKWFYYLWTLHYLPQFKAIANDKATTMGHIKREHLDKAMVYIPPSDLLNKYNNIIAPLIEEIVNLQKENIHLTETRDMLLPRLMKGEI